MDTLRDERNRWAHGSIRFRQEKRKRKLKLQSYLFYVNSKGEERETKLTDAYFDQLSDKFTTIRGILTRIMKKRKILKT